MKNRLARVLAVAITIVIIVAIILTGPAKALILGFTISNPIPQKGEIVNFRLALDFSAGDSLDIKNLSLAFKGPMNKSCVFTIEGIPITGCSDILIQADINNLTPSYGYGYAQNPSQARYNITLDTANFIPGTYKVKLTAKLPGQSLDSSERTFVVQPAIVPITIVSPVEGQIYDKRQIPVEILFGAKLQSFMLTDEDRDFRTLCRDCKSYSQTKPFDDGQHSIIVKAVLPDGKEAIKIVNFIVDSRAPRAIDIDAERITNGSFSLTFQEENPDSLIFFYGTSNITRNKTIDIQSCSDEKPNTKCQFSADLAEFNNQKIQLWFSIKDIAGKTDISRKESSLADTLKPVINSFNMTKAGQPAISVKFRINITEDNFDSVLLTKESGVNPVTTTLCSVLNKGICERTRMLKSGDIISLAITDKAGNKVEIDNLIV